MPPGANIAPYLGAYYTDSCGIVGNLFFNLFRWNGSGWASYFSEWDAGWVVCSCFLNPGDWGQTTTDAVYTGWGAYLTNTIAYDAGNVPDNTDGWAGFNIHELPNQATLGSPSNGASVTTLSPTLVASSAANNEGDAVSYQCQVATDSGFSNIIWSSSSWQSSASATMPTNSPVLIDRNTYYWRVWTQDAYGEASTPVNVSHFTVALPLWGTGTAQADKGWPMWRAGPLAVNEATGNLVLSAPSPSFATAAGTLHAAITYNSLATTNNGLGTGWQVGPQTNFPARLVVISGGSTIERIADDGTTVNYTLVPGSSVYLPPGGSSSQLTANPTSPITYTLVDDDGSVYTFRAGG